MLLRNRCGVFFFALTFVTACFVTACGNSSGGQATTDNPCPTPDDPPPLLQSFAIVHPTSFSAISATIMGVVPDDVGAAIGSGTAIRNRITYDRDGIAGEKEVQFKNELFLVDYPKPGNETLFAFIKVNVDNVETLCRSDTATPNATPPVDKRDLGRWVSVLLKGKIVDGVAIFGNPTGDNYTFTFAYPVQPGSASQYNLCADDKTSVSAHRFRDLVSVDAGRAVDYRDCADGSIAFSIE